MSRAWIIGHDGLYVKAVDCVRGGKLQLATTDRREEALRYAIPRRVWEDRNLIRKRTGVEWEVEEA